MSIIELGSAFGHEEPIREPDFQINGWMFYVDEGIQLWTDGAGRTHGYKIISNGNELFWVNGEFSLESYYGMGNAGLHQEVATKYKEFLAEQILMGEINSILLGEDNEYQT
jgi:hypothetical protein